MQATRTQRILIQVALTVAILACGTFTLPTTGTSTVAKIGDGKITAKQFQARVRLQRQQIINQYLQYSQYAQMFDGDAFIFLQQMESRLAPENAEALGQEVLDSMISEVLLMQEADRRGSTVSEAEIDARIQAAFGYFPNGEPTATVTPTEVIMPTISAQQATIVTITPMPPLELTPSKTAIPAPTSTPQPTATPLTLQSFEESKFKSMETFKGLGFTEADYRQLVKADILRERLFNVITDEIKPVQDMVWARHILVLHEATAIQVRERILKGEDFAVVAAEVSIDESNKDQGGDLGWFGKGVMIAPFEEAAFSQKVGEIGNPVQTDFGWHIIQVIGHEERPLTADQFDQAKQAAWNKWLEELRKKAEDTGLITIYESWKQNIPLDPDLTSLGQ